MTLPAPAERPISTPTVRPYVLGDVRRLRLSPASEQALGGMPRRTLEAAALAWPSVAVTLEWGGSPLACWGLMTRWRGLAEAWLVVDVRVAHHPVMLVKAVKAWLEEQCVEKALRRVQCHIRYGHSEAERFARVLGFAQEALMACYGPDGAAYWLMAIVRGDA